MSSVQVGGPTNVDAKLGHEQLTLLFYFFFHIYIWGCHTAVVRIVWEVCGGTAIGQVAFFYFVLVCVGAEEL